MHAPPRSSQVVFRLLSAVHRRELHTNARQKIPWTLIQAFSELDSYDTWSLCNAGGSDNEENDEEIEPADDDREFMKLLANEIDKVTQFYTSKVCSMARLDIHWLFGQATRPTLSLKRRSK